MVDTYERLVVHEVVDVVAPPLFVIMIMVMFVCAAHVVADSGWNIKQIIQD